MAECVPVGWLVERPDETQAHRLVEQLEQLGARCRSGRAMIVARKRSPATEARSRTSRALRDSSDNRAAIASRTPAGSGSALDTIARSSCSSSASSRLSNSVMNSGLPRRHLVDPRHRRGRRHDALAQLDQPPDIAVFQTLDGDRADRPDELV